MYYVTLGARQRLFNDKVAINLSVIDPFDLYRWDFNTSDKSHVQTSRSSYSMRRASISISYNFGRSPESARRGGQPEAVEEVPDPAAGGGGIR